MEKKYRITVDGREYSVTVEDLSEGGSLLYPDPGSMRIPAPRPAAATPVPVPVPAPGPAAAGAVATGDVTSTMGGVLDSIAVVLGQTVSAGDTVAVVEAMKMKTPMIARISGKVTNIAVKAGDPVEPGQILLTIS
ncbi:MAG: biotin/lipoyl-binding protein [Dechloromonas sp.]|jgi:biotin carboxyl carrier protein|nr:biotin/lipoyl-binding protein [Dechloromonas sp.]